MYCIFKLKPRHIKLFALLLSLLLAVLVIWLVNSGAKETSVSSDDMHTLIIDAGHGGIDGGAIAENGSRESDINLAIAQKLRAMAEFYGLDNIMVRQDDSTKSSTENYSEHDDLVNRTSIVNKANNPVLISIHQNCFPTGQPSGPQVLYSNSKDSERLGKLTHQNLIKSLAPECRRVPEPASKGLYMMSHVSCPAILVECGFMSNTSDLTNLSNENYQSSVSAVILASYLQYRNGLINT